MDRHVHKMPQQKGRAKSLGRMGTPCCRPSRATAGRCSLADAIEEKLKRDLARVKAKKISRATFRYHQGKCRVLLANWPTGTTLQRINTTTVDAYRVQRVELVSDQTAGKELEVLRQVMVVAKRAGW